MVETYDQTCDYRKGAQKYRNSHNKRDTFDQMKMLENEPPERGAGSMASRWGPELRF